MDAHEAEVIELREELDRVVKRHREATEGQYAATKRAESAEHTVRELRGPLDYHRRKAAEFREALASERESRKQAEAALREAKKYIDGYSKLLRSELDEIINAALIPQDPAEPERGK